MRFPGYQSSQSLCLWVCYGQLLVAHSARELVHYSPLYDCNHMNLLLPPLLIVMVG